MSAFYSSSEGIAILCEKGMRAKYDIPGNKQYPHGIVRYRFDSEASALMMQREIANYWTMSHPDVVYVPLDRK